MKNSINSTRTHNLSTTSTAAKTASITPTSAKSRGGGCKKGRKAPKSGATSQAGSITQTRKGRAGAGTSKRVNSRAKGANGERELAGILQDYLGIKLVRNLEQTRNGGYDLVTGEDHPISNFAIEVKRYAKVTGKLIVKWWGQAEKQAHDAGKIPVLAYRSNRGEWRFRVPMALFADGFSGAGIDWTVELGIECFCYVVRENICRSEVSVI